MAVERQEAEPVSRTGAVQIQVVGDDRAALERMIEELVARRLVACGQLLGPVASTYRWQGAVEHADEWLALLKTRSDRAPEVVAAVAERHGYDVPEIVVVPLTGGLEAYLDWIRAEAGAGS